jgi:hypothetical protein
MTPGIDDKIARLSPEGQKAVLAFVEFLLSRETGRDEVFDIDDDFYEEAAARSEETKDQKSEDNCIPHMGKTLPDGIILADERPIEEKESLIDFADINTRFSHTDKKEETKGPVRQRKMFDWL